MISINPSTPENCELFLEHDHHISKTMLLQKISLGEVFLIRSDDSFAGWFRYNFFWDNTPFLNMLYLLEPYRGLGIGRRAMEFWQAEMKKLGYDQVMTSTLANEQAQHFYRKLGYRDAGCLLLEGEPLEILFVKNLED